MAGFVSYIKDSFDELVNKVTWPTIKELTASAFLVLIASLIISIIVFGMDFVFGVQTKDYWKGILGYLYDLIG